MNVWKKKFIAFTFTVNNWERHELDSIKKNSNQSDYLIVRPEIGANGTKHLQGYVEFPTRIAPDTCRKRLGLYRAAIFVARGNAEQNRAYIMKPETKDGEAFEHGQLPTIQQGKRTDLTLCKEFCKTAKTLEQIDDAFPTIMAKYPRWVGTQLSRYNMRRTKPNVEWRWGVSGSGKSWTTNILVKGRTIPILGHPWFDGYNGGPVLWIEDYSPNMCGDYQMLLKVLDQYPCTVPVKGGHIPMNAMEIYVTSHDHPRTYVPKGQNAFQLLRRITRIIEYVRPYVDVRSVLNNESRVENSGDIPSAASPVTNAIAIPNKPKSVHIDDGHNTHDCNDYCIRTPQRPESPPPMQHADRVSPLHLDEEDTLRQRLNAQQRASEERWTNIANRVRQEDEKKQEQQLQASNPSSDLPANPMPDMHSSLCLCHNCQVRRTFFGCPPLSPLVPLPKKTKTD